MASHSGAAPAPARRFRILTTDQLTNRLPELVDVTWFDMRATSRPDRVRRLLGLIARAQSYDALLSFNPGIEMTVVAFLVRVLSGHRTFVVFFDPLLHQPNNLKDQLATWPKRRLFWGVDKFFC